MAFAPPLTRFAGFLVALASLAPLPSNAADGPAQIQGDDKGPVTLLPPLLVHEQRSGPKWRHVQVDGVEVLSRCDDRTTVGFLKAFLLRRLELGQILPQRLQVSQSVPITLILITPAAQKKMSEELANAMKAPLKDQTSGYVTPDASAEQVYRLVRTMPQMTLVDSESTGMIYTLDPDQHGPVKMDGQASAFFGGLKNDGNYSDLHFTAGRIGTLLGDRTPPLPVWFKSGFLSFFRDIDWTDPKSVFVPTLSWVSNELTRKAKSDSTYSPTLLPMPRLFSGPLGGASPFTAEESNLWGSQMSLFLRWAYSDAKRREALWEFVDQSSRDQVTEGLLRRCFGVGSIQLGRQLLDYLPKALKSRQALIDVSLLRIPDCPLEDAAPAEVARIKGDMGRKEIEYVKENDASSVPQYVGQVGTGLRGAYEEGERDPALLAVLGLYECDIGDYEAARPFLESAGQAHVARPSLYVELATIRYKHSLAQPTGADGKLGAEQVAEILGFVRESLSFQPPQIEAYALAVNTWAQAAVSPAPSDLTLLNQGAELFPKSADLVLGVANLYIQRGLPKEALKIVDRAVQCNEANSGTSARLLGFRTQISAPQSTAP